LRLLLDEHFSPLVAEELRKRGHDVVAAAAIPELRHREDADLLAWGTSQRRALVTENAADCVRLHQLHLSRGDRHYGIVLTSPRRFPSNRAGIFPLVRALDKLLQSFQEEDALLADLQWLCAAEDCWAWPTGVRSRKRGTA